MNEFYDYLPGWEIISLGKNLTWIIQLRQNPLKAKNIVYGHKDNRFRRNSEFHSNIH